MILTKLNELQVPTWRWLRMNATEMEIDAALGTPYRGGTLSGAEQVRVERSAQLTAAEHLPDHLFTRGLVMTGISIVLLVLAQRIFARLEAKVPERL